MHTYLFVCELHQWITYSTDQIQPCHTQGFRMPRNTQFHSSNMIECIDLTSAVGPSHICLSACVATLFSGDLEGASPKGNALLLGSHQAVLACLPAQGHNSGASSSSLSWCSDSVLSILVLVQPDAGRWKGMGSRVQVTNEGGREKDRKR